MVGVMLYIEDPCDKVCQWLATGQWFSLATPVSSTNKTDHHDITEILLKVVWNTIKSFFFKLFQELPPFDISIIHIFRKRSMVTLMRYDLTGRWFSLATPVSSTNKTDHHDITEILLKVVWNTITLTLGKYNLRKHTFLHTHNIFLLTVALKGRV
jgi:hypothetical protein